MFDKLLENYHTMMNDRLHAKQPTCCHCHSPPHLFSQTKINYEISVLKLFDWIIHYNCLTRAEEGTLSDFLCNITATSTATSKDIASGIEDCIAIAKSSLHNENDMNRQMDWSNL